MGRIAFAPVAIAGGLVAGLISKKAFDLVWARVSEEEPPEPEERDVSLPWLVAALAAEGALFRVAKGLADHGARVGFERFTGTWPGEQRPDPA